MIMKKKALIMANGDYGSDIKWYLSRINEYHLVVCADGGTNAAMQIGIRPDIVIGDMDSIDKESRAKAKDCGASFVTFSSEKDSTDTDLAMRLVSRKGYDAVVIWGGTGSRLDHTLANLFCGTAILRSGMDIRFESPCLTVYFTDAELDFKGDIGDTVSVIPLGGSAKGVFLKGFKYPLNDAILNSDQSLGISNEMAKREASVTVKNGVLAVFHYLSGII